MKTLSDRLKEAKAEAKIECEKQGQHVWDNPIGVLMKQEMPAQYLFGGTLREATEWDEFHRTCTLCGRVEIEREQTGWMFDEGMGHFKCDPRTGHVRWVTAPIETKKTFYNEVLGIPYTVVTRHSKEAEC